MKKIINPYNNFCIGCSPKNPYGLNMSFLYDEDNKQVVSQWNPDEHYQGYPNVLHGGIQSLMIDEIAAWSVYILLETSGVTQKLSVEYKKPLYLSKGAITLKSELKATEKRSAKFNVSLFDGENNLCSAGVADYFIYPKSLAVKKFNYPGLEAFFEKK